MKISMHRSCFGTFCSSVQEILASSLQDCKFRVSLLSGAIIGAMLSLGQAPIQAAKFQYRNA
jgi:hypothetical protein